MKTLILLIACAVTLGGCLFIPIPVRTTHEYRVTTVKPEQTTAAPKAEEDEPRAAQPAQPAQHAQPAEK